MNCKNTQNQEITKETPTIINLFYITTFNVQRSMFNVKRSSTSHPPIFFRNARPQRCFTTGDFNARPPVNLPSHIILPLLRRGLGGGLTGGQTGGLTGGQKTPETLYTSAFPTTEGRSAKIIFFPFIQPHV